MKRFIPLLFLVALCFTSLVPNTTAQAAPRIRCFPETGFCVSSPILEYWEQNGGLPVFGYPISDRHMETCEGWTGSVQWFERNRLEDHGAEGIMSGRVGALYLQAFHDQWRNYPTVTEAPPGCRFFPETGHSLCGMFLNYWNNNGGLARFGYPITEPHTEILFDFEGTVQYFERSRMEYHPELSGTPHVVSLGLLGKDIYRYYDECAPVSASLQTTVAMYPDLLSCASDYSRENVQMAVQPFERGMMLWVENPYYDSGTIWVIFYDGARNMLVNQNYIDMWREGLPLSDETPPPGLIEPLRGFGYVWRTYPEVRYTLGWATAPEQTDRGTAQMFRGSTWVIHRMSNDHVFILQLNGRVDEIPQP